MRRSTPGPPAVRGTIRRRLLVNALVDPDEAGARLPAGLRPHVLAGGTVVGCCLLDLDGVRPGALPARAGITLRAAAHRVSVEWDDADGEAVVGVYVPVRHTASRLAVALGGRAFPGVHRRARVAIDDTDATLAWTVEEAGAGDDHRIALRVQRGDAVAAGPVAGACLGATVALSPGRDGTLEAAHMVVADPRAREVTVETLRSAFLDGFATAVPAPAFLVEDAAVTWTFAA